MIKLEFGEKVLGESQNMECGSDGSIEFKFKAELNCVFDDPFALDEIAHKPVICKCAIFQKLCFAVIYRTITYSFLLYLLWIYY